MGTIIMHPKIWKLAPFSDSWIFNTLNLDLTIINRHTTHFLTEKLKNARVHRIGVSWMTKWCAGILSIWNSERFCTQKTWHTHTHTHQSPQEEKEYFYVCWETSTNKMTSAIFGELATKTSLTKSWHMTETRANTPKGYLVWIPPAEFNAPSYPPHLPTHKANK